MLKCEKSHVEYSGFWAATPVDDEIKAFVLSYALSRFEGPVYCGRGDGEKHLHHRIAIIKPCDLSHAS